MPRKKKLTNGLENLSPEPAGTSPVPSSESPHVPTPNPSEVTESAEDTPRASDIPVEDQPSDTTAIPDMAVISKQSQQVLLEALEAFDDVAGEAEAILEPDIDETDARDIEDEFEESPETPEIAKSKDQVQTKPATAAGKMLQLVIFKLADEVYGVDIAAIEQIIELQRITTVPRTPFHIAGLTNLRGTVLPVIDLRKRLGLPVQDPTRETRIVVAQIGGARVGMIVDAVIEVRRVPEASVEPPSPLVTTIDSAYITGIAKLSAEAKGRSAGQLIVLVDLEQILPGVNAP